MKETVFVSVVLYVCNDVMIVANSLKKLNYIMSKTFKNYEIIIVNDSSNDGSLDKIRNTIEKINGNTTIINLSRKHGVENAMLAGLNKSMGDFVYEIDSCQIDFPINIIPDLYKTAVKGFDIVAGSSKVTPITSKLFYKLINKVAYINLSLSSENIRIVSRRALNGMLNLKEKVRYRKALYAFTGFSKTKVDYEIISNINTKKRKVNRENISTALDIIVSFSNIGLKAAHYMSLIFFIFSLFMAGYAFYNYIFNKNIVEGWTTLMILISTGFAGIFFIIGIIGEYISRMLIEIQNRPFYSTKSVEIYKEKPFIPLADQEVAASIES